MCLAKRSADSERGIIAPQPKQLNSGLHAARMLRFVTSQFDPTPLKTILTRGQIRLDFPRQASVAVCGQCRDEPIFGPPLALTGSPAGLWVVGALR